MARRVRANRVPVERIRVNNSNRRPDAEQIAVTKGRGAAAPQLSCGGRIIFWPSAVTTWCEIAHHSFPHQSAARSTEPMSRAIPNG